MNLRAVFTGVFLMLACAASAQPLPTQKKDVPLLDLKDAIEIALNNNFNIRLAKNNVSIARNNVSPGMAGMTPLVTADGQYNKTIQDVNQIRADGSQQVVNRAGNTNYGYGANLNWTLFDGLGMFANYNQLKQLLALGEVQLRDTIQSTIADVITTYYDLVSQNRQIKALESAVDISRTQYRITSDKFSVGAASRLEVYNAQVNLNADTSLLLQQVEIFNTTRIALNQVLARNVQTDFTVGDTIILDKELKLGDVLSSVQENNTMLKSAQLNQRLAEINLRQVKSTRYPVIIGQSGYNWNYVRNPAGFARRSDSKGFTYGATVSLPIFNGFVQNRIEKNARLGIENSKLQAERTKLGVDAQVNSLFVSYLNSIQLSALETKNIEIARRNLSISLEKFKIGNITQLEIREAQRNFLDAQSRFVNAQYQAKLTETALREMMGNIQLDK
ncbi:MAG: TolC family protein [Mucilaginibacter polytrichastri]|nr:TolC family protein [Mucilaginibacter polytrichastri]